MSQQFGQKSGAPANQIVDPFMPPEWTRMLKMLALERQLKTEHETYRALEAQPRARKKLLAQQAVIDGLNQKLTELCFGPPQQRYL